jgi:hypothetical protein
MRYGARSVAVVLIILLMGSINAFAVGYEQYRPAGRAAEQSCGWWESLKKGFFVEKYPEIIDGAASTVRDLLGQFGVLDRKTP